MKLHFNKIKLVNFCSYTDSEIKLSNKNFCLVSGQNNYIKDNALSNGSGKSTIWSAICWALTGETISGLKTNLKNITNDDDTSFVSLDITVDNDNYIITRYIAPKSDLKILKNSIDISGKGIRESEKILAVNLPDITKDLISSTILLGQGMPNRFSSFTPSGRKDLLEQLTKSDFMIDDIKSRIAARYAELTKQLRNYEDGILTNKTQLGLVVDQLEKAKTDLAACSTVNYKQLIDETNLKITDCTNKINYNNELIETLELANEKYTNNLLTDTAAKAAENDAEFNAYSTAYNKYLTEKQLKQNSIKFLRDEIRKLSEVKDICPTCGQKIPGVLKPDTTEQLDKISSLELEISDLDSKLSATTVKHQEYLTQIEQKYININGYQDIIKNNKLQLASIKAENIALNAELTTSTAAVNKLIYDKQNDDNVVSSLKSTITRLEKYINTIQNAIKIVELASVELNERITINKQMDTMSKREFRGYLLYNIIEYLDKKAKEYSNIVFGTSELKIYLDNNALDISYCDKLYESLSGGEKQRVDLITQFAIRDLLQYYFNYSSNILVLDEITDNLDKLATGKIFDLITDKLRDIESIFIISHHADELEIPVDSEIKVIKDKNGVSLIQEF